MSGRVVYPTGDFACRECGEPCEVVSVKPREEAEELERIAEVRCPNGHVMVAFLKPDQTAIGTGRKLMRRRADGVS